MTRGVSVCTLIWLLCGAVAWAAATPGPATLRNHDETILRALRAKEFEEIDCDTFYGEGMSGAGAHCFVSVLKREEGVARLSARPSNPLRKVGRGWRVTGNTTAASA